MSGKTHAVVGAATAVFCLQPQTADQLALCLGAGAIGGLAVDIDSKQSQGAKAYRKIIAALVIILLGVVVSIYYQNQYVLDILKGMNLLKVCAFFILMLLLGVGYTKPHRMYTHSFEWAFAEFFCVFIVNHVIGIAFLTGYLAHMFVDLFNEKNVRLSILLDWKVCFRFFPASGRANAACCTLGTAALICYIGINMPSMLNVFS